MAVILTLSSQSNSAELNASRTVAAKTTSSSSVLKMGSKGTKVKELQKELTKLGYSTNGIDGKFGSGTKKAVIAFQKAYGLTADGIVGATTQNAIAKAISNHNKGIYTVGSRGEKVKKLQGYLTKLGFNTKGIDGIFGSGTKSAVIAFQKAYGLTADGIIGEETQNAITKTIKNLNKGFLAKGIKSSKVKELQKNLIKLGYKVNGTSGVFDGATKKAVVAFQKANGLTQNGIVGSAVQKAIEKALKAKKIITDNEAKIQRMLDNINNDKSLNLSKDQKTAMIVAAERLLKEKYEPEFVAGVLGNIQAEGKIGQFESSDYRSEPSKEPAYLKYMDSKYNYRKKYSGKSIMDIGISATIKLQKKAEDSNYAGKFGLGMIQWTGDRTGQLLESYKKYAKNDKPTKEECIKAEVNFMIDELQGGEKKVYSAWKSGNKTAKSAGDTICRQYVRPQDESSEAKKRSNNAKKIYELMMK